METTLDPASSHLPRPSGVIESAWLPDSGVLRARRVLSLSPGLSGDAIWWSGGRIQGVGSVAAIDRQAPKALPRFDHPDSLVTPGFVDGHTHFAMWAVARRRVRLAGARTRAEAVARVAAGAPSQGWMVGHGWDANRWAETPDRHVLDDVHAIPVYLDSLDVHAAWVNSAALAVARVTRDTPDPPGGRIVRDGSGEPTGVLLERAVELVAKAVPAPSDEILDDAIREAQTEAHRLGVTGIHDVEDERAWRAFRRLEQSGELRLRVLFHPPVAALPDLVRRGARSGAGSAWLGMGGVKLFLDGSLGSRTAWMLEPYEGSRDRGLPVAGEGEAREAMRTAAVNGIAVTVHAIGDAAVRRALDLLETLPRVALPHRIEHLQCIHPADLARVARSGVVASMQPAHLLTDIPLVERHWGGRGRGAYAFRSLLRRGTAVVFGSDVPVASIDPREGVYAALERKGFDGAPRAGWRPEERIGFEDVVRGYTVAAAHASGTSRRLGTLARGAEADLVAWAVDSAAEGGDGDAFRRGRAVLTVVGGRVVMHRS
ncbi:MAG: amidohydrolase [Gemmatimonadales bacterium]|nr:amidohydrolase [Gemmatimonadales bacterium]